MPEKIEQRVDHQQDQPADPSKRELFRKAGEVLRVLAFGTLGGVTFRALDRIQTDRTIGKRYQEPQEHRSDLIKKAIEQPRTGRPDQVQPLVLGPESLKAIQAGKAYERQDKIAVNLRYGAEQFLVIALAWLVGLRAIRLEEENQESQTSIDSPGPVEHKAKPRSEWIL